MTRLGFLVAFWRVRHRYRWRIDANALRTEVRGFCPLQAVFHARRPELDTLAPQGRWDYRTAGRGLGLSEGAIVALARQSDGERGWLRGRLRRIAGC